MMIKVFDAIIAETTMRASWWPEYLTSPAVFQKNTLPIDENLLAKQKVWVLFVENEA
jgi:hypothetical protein